MNKKISVAMTSCNGSKYIKEQIDSVLDQQLRPAEIIVCDDASVDDTIEILLDYEQKGHIKLYRNTERLGIINNFKKAVSLCDEDNYIALCDQDDYWLPDKLKLNMEAISTLEASNKPSLVYSDLSLVDDNLATIRNSFWYVLNIIPENERLRSLLFGNFITGCSIMMNKKMRRLFCDMPGTNIIMHDAWVALIAFTFGNSKYIDKPLVLYRQHGENATYETNKEETLITKLLKAYKQMLHNKNFLSSEMLMAKTFMEKYGERLTAEEKNIFNTFITLERSSFMKKKMFSILSRSYRISNLFSTR